MTTPLTNGDLRQIAEALDELEASGLAANPAIGAIRLKIDGEIFCGYAVRFDDSDPDMGWGFIQSRGR